MVWLTPSFAAINLPPSSLLHSRVQRPTAAADTAAADRLWDALMLKLMLLLLQLQLMLHQGYCIYYRSVPRTSEAKHLDWPP